MGLVAPGGEAASKLLPAGGKCGSSQIADRGAESLLGSGYLEGSRGKFCTGPSVTHENFRERLRETS